MKKVKKLRCINRVMENKTMKLNKHQLLSISNQPINSFDRYAVDIGF